jgi:hypothetical protein
VVTAWKERSTIDDRRILPGSARVSRAGFGVSPKQASTA